MYWIALLKKTQQTRPLKNSSGIPGSKHDPRRKNPAKELTRNLPHPAGSSKQRIELTSQPVAASRFANSPSPPATPTTRSLWTAKPSAPRKPSPLEKKPTVTFERLLDAAALGTTEVAAVESLAGRLERRFDAEVVKTAKGQTLSHIANETSRRRLRHDSRLAETTSGRGIGMWRRKAIR